MANKLYGVINQIGKLSYIILVILLFSACGEYDTTIGTGECNSYCQTDASERAGAKCNDGTESTATGSGACSHHDGVSCWICK